MAIDKIIWNEGEKCPVCKNGRIALGHQITSDVDFDAEPYENGIQEREEEEFKLNEPINLTVNFCDDCGEIFGIYIQNDLNKYKY